MTRSLFLNAEFDLLSKKETIEMIVSAIDSGRFGYSRGDINVATVVSIQSNIALRQAINENDIVNFDGVGAIWGAKFLKIPCPERITGIDLFSALIGVSEQKRYRVFFLGSTEDTLQNMIANLKVSHPNLLVAGSHNGYFWGKEKDVVDLINKSQAQLLFIGIKSPEKELFIQEWRRCINVNFLMGVGGTFDVISGKINRAPDWMQQGGLEWLFRIIQEPRRMWKRYLVSNFKFAYLLLRARAIHFLK